MLWILALISGLAFWILVVWNYSLTIRIGKLENSADSQPANPVAVQEEGLRRGSDGLWEPAVWRLADKPGDRLVPVVDEKPKKRRKPVTPKGSPWAAKGMSFDERYSGLELKRKTRSVRKRSRVHKSNNR